VNEGLVVKLVLDCCFSASVCQRDDSAVRFLPYDAKIDSKSPEDPEKSHDNGAFDLVSHDVFVRLSWLINPNGYAILATIGTHPFDHLNTPKLP
jgi:hypothetical protein